MRVIWGNRIFWWEPLVGSIGYNYFVCKLNYIAAKREVVWLSSLRVQGVLALGVAGSRAEAVFSFRLSFLWVWPQVTSVQQEKWSRHDGSSGS